MSRFCASCISDIPDGAKTGVIGAAIVCEECAFGDVDSRMPEHRQRGYVGGDGGIGTRFSESVRTAYNELGAARTGTAFHENLISGRSATPGYRLIRILHGDGDGMDKRTAANEVRRKHGSGAVFIGAVNESATEGYFLFEIPLPVTQTPPDPLSPMEPYRRKP